MNKHDDDKFLSMSANVGQPVAMCLQKLNGRRIQIWCKAFRKTVSPLQNKKATQRNAQPVVALVANISHNVIRSIREACKGLYLERGGRIGLAFLRPSTPRHPEKINKKMEFIIHSHP